MQTQFNSISCVLDRNNTGFGKCVAKLGMLMYDIALPRNTRVTLANVQEDAFEAWLTAGLTNDDPTKRFYILGKYWKVEDSSVEPVSEAGDGGVDDILYDGAYKWLRTQKEGGMCAHTGLQKFTNSQDQFDFFHVFKSNDESSRYYIVGTTKFNITSQEPEMSGVRLDTVFSPKMGIATGTTAPKFQLMTTMLDVAQINRDRGFVGVNFEIADLPRVMDVNVRFKKASTGVFGVLATMACGGDNLTTLYSTLDDPDAWVVYNELGAIVPVTSVAVVDGEYRLSLTVADAAYTAGTKFRAKLAALSVITASPIDADYLESSYTNYAVK